MICFANFLFSAQYNSSVIREWTLHLIVLLYYVMVDSDINYPNQRVFWSDFSLYTTTKIFLFSFLPSEWHHWQLQTE